MASSMEAASSNCNSSQQMQQPEHSTIADCQSQADGQKASKVNRRKTPREEVARRVDVLERSKKIRLDSENLESENRKNCEVDAQKATNQEVDITDASNHSNAPEIHGGDRNLEAANGLAEEEGKVSQDECSEIPDNFPPIAPISDPESSNQFLLGAPNSCEELDHFDGHQEAGDAGSQWGMSGGSSAMSHISPIEGDGESENCTDDTGSGQGETRSHGKIPNMRHPCMLFDCFENFCLFDKPLFALYFHSSIIKTY